MGGSWQPCTKCGSYDLTTFEGIPYRLCETCGEFVAKSKVESLPVELRKSSRCPVCAGNRWHGDNAIGVTAIFKTCLHCGNVYSNHEAVPFVDQEQST